MKRAGSTLSIYLAMAASLTAIAPVHADTLLIDRAAQPAASATPSRGQTMQQVQARFGAPVEQLAPRGGQKQQWPAIHRWVYPQFTVYFERQRVIDVVLNHAGPGELGPKPPLR